MAVLSGIHTSICMREYAEMPEPNHTVISLSRESHSHSTSHTSHRTNFVGGHSKRSTVQTVRPFTNAFGGGTTANVRGEKAHIRIYTCVHMHTRVTVGAHSRFPLANRRCIGDFAWRPSSSHNDSRLANKGIRLANRRCIGDFPVCSSETRRRLA